MSLHKTAELAHVLQFIWHCIGVVEKGVTVCNKAHISFFWFLGSTF